MKIKTLVLGGIALAISAAAIPAYAHHSYAMFDASKKLTLEGTIKEFQWTNPHSWILMMAPNEAGVMEQWAIELGSPSGLARQGWVPKTIVPGDKVMMTMHPLKNGKPGGSFMAIKLPNGKVMGDPDAPLPGN